MSEEKKEFTFENEEYRQTYWHTCSHIMAQAVKRLWPEVKLAIGPSIKEGWYYDMDAPFAFTPEHMEKIEAEMRKICKEDTMGLIKLIIKLVVLPLIVAVTLIQWVGIFFTQFSTVIFNLLAGLMFLITIAGWMFGISAGAETLRLLAVAFVVFIIPHIAEWLIIRIAVINYGLRDFIKS